MYRYDHGFLIKVREIVLLSGTMYGFMYAIILSPRKCSASQYKNQFTDKRKKTILILCQWAELLSFEKCSHWHYKDAISFHISDIGESDNMSVVSVHCIQHDVFYFSTDKTINVKTVYDSED